MRLATAADVLIEGFRPGVMERFGLGPEPCMAANPRLVYGRLSGWGQHGPLARTAGHDIDYIALSGALFHGGHRDAPPAAPPTLVGDLGGGAMLLLAGILAALFRVGQDGGGQVVDAAISDGAVLLTTLLVGLQQQGRWSDRRQANLLDGGAHWYDCYECADGGFLAVGALEPRFYRELLEKCGLGHDPSFDSQYDPASWPRQKEKLAALFRTRSRAEWTAHFEGSDACVAPVLNLSEARAHPHHLARAAYLQVDGVSHPAPAPRFGRTPGRIGSGPPAPGEHTVEILAAAGFSHADIGGLREAEAI
jgi:alpha-methylacyl-CoA racemase